jgi:Putative Ig domain
VKHEVFFKSVKPLLTGPAARRAATAVSVLGLCAGATLTATGTAHAASSVTAASDHTASASAKAVSPLAVVTTYLSPAPAQTSYKGQLAATGGTKPYSWSIESGTLPTGLTLNSSTGAITGKPSWTGTFDFTAEVTDSEATPVSATQAESITVTAPTLAVTTTSLPGATDGVSYSQKLAATGGISPYTWALSAGSLPEGLTLKPDGTITGKPKTSGTFTFTAEVADSDSPFETATASLSITVGISPLTITTTSLPVATPNQPNYSADLTASGGIGKYTWQVISGSLPAGLRLSPSGLISALGGGVSGSGTYQFEVQVTDSEVPAQSATETLEIQVGGL